MRLTAILILSLLATPVMAQPRPVCGTGQTCPPDAIRVPYPVINPVQGLTNMVTGPLRQDQPQPPPVQYQAPIATPPPNLPPDLQR